MNVWDFGGQEIYHATHQFFLTRRSLYVLVDDTRLNDKFASDPGFKEWLDWIEVFAGDSPVLIFQNEKADRSKEIDIRGIKGRYHNVKELSQGNLENPRAADNFRKLIGSYVETLKHVGERLPARWIKVRRDIQSRAREVPYITQDEYFEIYRRHFEFDKDKALSLSQYLHDLGVFLHFQNNPLLARTVILQNEWATRAAYRILDAEKIKTQQGRFNEADYEWLWRDSIYADKHLELLELMKRFELCYELRDSNPTTWLATRLLPLEKPKDIAEWGTAQDDLVLRYRYEFLPKGLISRLIVRVQRFVSNPHLAWATGVRFDRYKTAVLVELLKNGKEIEMRARGPERKALLTVIEYELDMLNDSFSGLAEKVDKLVPCNCKVCRLSTAPHFFTQKDLRRRKESSVVEVECPESFQKLDVLELFEGARMNRLPNWAEQVPTLLELRIFVAGSKELEEDKAALKNFVRKISGDLRTRGVALEVFDQADFLAAFSATRSQDEYNKAICDCQMFICLISKKTGKYTKEEFEVAYQHFKENGTPLIYTFFKVADMTTREIDRSVNSMLKFRDRVRKLGQFPSEYHNVYDLREQFREQIEMMIGGEYRRTKAAGANG